MRVRDNETQPPVSQGEASAPPSDQPAPPAIPGPDVPDKTSGDQISSGPLPDTAAALAPATSPLNKKTFCIWIGEPFGEVQEGQLVAVAPLAAERLRNEGRARYATPDEARDRAAAVSLHAL